MVVVGRVKSMVRVRVHRFPQGRQGGKEMIVRVTRQVKV